MAVPADLNEIAHDALLENWGVDAEVQRAGGVSRINWRTDAGWLSATELRAAEDMRREAVLLARLKGLLFVDVPELIPTSDGKGIAQFCGFAWRLTKNVRGRASNASSVEDCRASTEGLRLLHGQLRSLDGRGLAPSIIESVKQTLASSPRDPVLRPALDWLAAHIDSLEPLPRQPVHGDWTPSNLLLSDAGSARLVGVLDWEHASVDPVVFDLAQVASTLLMWSGRSDAREYIDQLPVWYGDGQITGEVLRTAMVTFWVHNYRRVSEWMKRSPERYGPVFERQPSRLATVLDFVTEI